MKLLVDSAVLDLLFDKVELCRRVLLKIDGTEGERCS